MVQQQSVPQLSAEGKQKLVARLLSTYRSDLAQALVADWERETALVTLLELARQVPRYTRPTGGTYFRSQLLVTLAVFLFLLLVFSLGNLLPLLPFYSVLFFSSHLGTVMILHSIQWASRRTELKQKLVLATEGVLPECAVEQLPLVLPLVRQLDPTLKSTVFRETLIRLLPRLTPEIAAQMSVLDRVFLTGLVREPDEELVIAVLLALGTFANPADYYPVRFQTWEGTERVREAKHDCLLALKPEG